jgi:Uma2 family endonuclease
MGATTKISFEEFKRLQETTEETIHYELDEGELILTPSPTPRHNIIYMRLWAALRAFVKEHHLGVVVTELDFRLARDTVRKPDVAFIGGNQMKGFHLDRTPVEGPPTLAVEVISPGNLAQDTRKKVRQYLSAGTQSVWLIYPTLKIIELHEPSGSRNVTEPEFLSEEKLLRGHRLLLSLAELFDENPE